MSESYVEILVKKENTMAGAIFRAVGIALTVSLIALSFLGGGLLFLLLAGACGIGTYFIFLNTDLEYEYLYVDKELSVDKIMAKSKRKKVASFDMERLEMFAPEKSFHLDEYKNRSYKESDYSTGKNSPQPGSKYVMIYDGKEKIFFSEGERLAAVIKNVAPRKVFFD